MNNPVDTVIMDAVFVDDSNIGKITTRGTFIVATGMWRMYDDGDIAYILYTDDYYGDRVFSAVLKEGCELIEGEKLCMFTNVETDDHICSLVLFKHKAYDPEGE
ncbi:hypothetical protein VAG18_002939 [Escherichia coli]|nr:hypothetical protein [Escherichia coli]